MSNNRIAPTRQEHPASGAAASIARQSLVQTEDGYWALEESSEAGDGAIAVNADGYPTAYPSDDRNVLPPEAWEEASNVGTFAPAFGEYLLADLGLAVGDIISYGGEVHSETGLDSLEVEVRFRDAADNNVETSSSNAGGSSGAGQHTSAAYGLVWREAKVIPAGAVKLTIRAHDFGGVAGNLERNYTRRFCIVKGATFVHVAPASDITPLRTARANARLMAY